MDSEWLANMKKLTDTIDVHVGKFHGRELTTKKIETVLNLGNRLESLGKDLRRYGQRELKRRGISIDRVRPEPARDDA